MTDDVRWSLDNIVQEHEQAMALGGDSELLRDAIRIGRQTLMDNGWWPDDDPPDWHGYEPFQDRTWDEESDVPVYTKYSDPPIDRVSDEQRHPTGR